MALFSFRILRKELNKNMLIVVFMSGGLLPEPGGHDWPQPEQDRARLPQPRSGARRLLTTKSESLWRIQPSPAKHLCHAANMKECHSLIWDFPATRSDIYRIKWAKKSTNIFQWREGGRRRLGWGGWSRWRHELFCTGSVFMLSLWHQEHLARASSARRVVTSNGLLSASQGDYLCTISGSLWSLCDNSILSRLHGGTGWVPWAVAFPRGAYATEI